MTSDRLRFGDIRRTSTFRLTLLLGTTFTVGLLALLGLVYALTTRELTARSDRILNAAAARLLDQSPADLPRQIAAEAARGNGLTFVELIAGDGEPVAGNLRIARPIGGGQHVEETYGGVPVRLIAVRTAAGETIVVGRDISQIRYLRGRILGILATSGIIILSGVSAAAVLLARQPLRRVRDFEMVARRIAAGRFDARMPLAGRHDELDLFAATVNALVAEMARIVAQVKGITEAVAHDLRTPLTRARARLEHGGRTAADPATAALIEAAVADLDSVLARFAALLRIAEIESGARRAAFAAVDLPTLAGEIKALYDPLADDRGITLRLLPGPPAVLLADRRLLVEAVSNLVDNAIKFAATEVSVAVEHRGGGPAIVVRDDGGGIAAADRDAAIHRFWRGANAAGLPGSGLGLSIVAAIAHLHGLDLRLDDGDPGLVATLAATSEVTEI